MTKELKIDEMFLDDALKENENPTLHKIKDGVIIDVEPSDDSDEKSDSTNKKILEILPFLDESYLMELAIKIIDNDSKYDNLQLKDVVCFMNSSDTDNVFFNLLTNKDERYKDIIPFISNEALSKIAHLYIEGKCQFIDMNSIYPFLSNEDIKLVFEAALKNRAENK